MDARTSVREWGEKRGVRRDRMKREGRKWVEREKWETKGEKEEKRGKEGRRREEGEKGGGIKMQEQGEQITHSVS